MYVHLLNNIVMLLDLDSEQIFEEYKSNVPVHFMMRIPEHLSRVKSRQSISTEYSKIIEILPKILGCRFNYWSSRVNLCTRYKRDERFKRFK